VIPKLVLQQTTLYTTANEQPATWRTQHATHIMHPATFSMAETIKPHNSDSALHTLSFSFALVLSYYGVL
jgi:hypothetical protein